MKSLELTQYKIECIKEDIINLTRKLHWVEKPNEFNYLLSIICKMQKELGNLRILEDKLRKEE